MGAVRSGLLYLSVCFAVSCLAQNTNSGDIRGTVTDSTGAVVPSVTVSVVDVDKGVTTTYVTDGSGLYDTGSIVPDHYIITFIKDGFAKLARGPITLEVGTTAVNGELTVGTETQTVTVSTDIPLLTTEEGSQSTTLSGNTMVQLPQIGANWTNFVVLLPGTTAKTGSAGNTGQDAASVNGNLPYSSILADGATTTLPASENADYNIFETVSEVKISTSAFSAQYGIGGTLYNQISKGGTSQYHGVLYEYFENNALNAAPYAFGAKGKVPILRYNNFGGTVGGPILKKKMFFYFDFDKTLSNGGAANGFISVPSASMLAGDFTGQPTLYDPTTQTIDGAGIVHRQSFASEYGQGNKIPAAMIDPVAKAIQGYFPVPNVPGTTVNGIPSNNYFYNVPSQSTHTKFFGRLDYDITSHNRLTLSDTQQNSPSVSLNQGLCPINCVHGDTDANSAQISDVWTFSPNAINEARMGYTDEFDFDNPESLYQGFPAKLGWQFAKADIFPTVNISGACCYSLTAGTHAVYKEFAFDPSDVVTLIRGKHVLHFGGEFLINRLDSTLWGNINAGTMNYTGQYTASTQGSTNTTGVPYADFLLGQTNGWSASFTPEYGGRLKSPQAFIQDDIKLRPNLTVNLGVRYQGMTGWSDVKNNMRAFDPKVLNPANNSYGAMWYGETHANGRRTLQAPIWDTFLPRVGFSYQLNPNTVIRGGFGIYGYTWSLDTYGSGLGEALGSQGASADATNGICPVVQLSSDGTTPSTTDPGCGAGSFNGRSINSLYIAPTTDPAAFNGQGVTVAQAQSGGEYLYNAYHTPIPKMNQWNLSVERELNANMLVSLSYVGGHGQDLVFPVDINQVPEDKLAPNDAIGATNARPYTLFQAISGSTNNAISNYNSLQAVIQKRMSSGLQFNFNYTWSHLLDDQDSSGHTGNGGTQVFQNSYVPSKNYGNSNLDIRNMVKGSAVYQLPIGQGRMFLNNNNILSQAIGGWQTAATVVLEGGEPFTPVMTNNNSYSQAGEQFPNLVGNPTAAPRDTKQWFNVAAYAAPPNGTFGQTSRNSLYGPGLTDVNFSLGKIFSFPLWKEGAQLQIRGDAQNIFNHPSFGQPDPNIGPGHTAQITTVTVSGRAMQLYARFSF